MFRSKHLSSLLGVLAILSGCSSAIPDRDPTGEIFPLVAGQSLQKRPVELPTALHGSPSILLIGYKQEAQFDIDRWLLSLAQLQVDVPIVEVPTIPGLVGSLASDWIDDGMRSGIPEDDWGAVVTLYGASARPVAEFTGTSRGQVARVIVLDANGRVAWFNDEGYSVSGATGVVNLLEKLQNVEG